MTRIIRETTTVTCNRCAYEDVWIPETPEYIKWEWSEFSQGDKSSVRMDICPRCTTELKKWIRNGR